MLSWSQTSIHPPLFSIFFSISKWKYFMVPFFVFLSGLRDPSKIQIPFRALFHWKMEMEKRGGAWKFGTMTTWSALEVVWSATFFNQS